MTRCTVKAGDAIRMLNFDSCKYDQQSLWLQSLSIHGKEICNDCFGMDANSMIVLYGQSCIIIHTVPNYCRARSL